MKRNIITAGIIATLLLFAAPTDCAAQTTTEAYIDINTTVEREVTPNELYLQITISEKDYKGKKSLEEMQEAMIGALKINRIDIPECLTLNYMGSEVGYKSFSKSSECFLYASNDIWSRVISFLIHSATIVPTIL